MSIIRKEAYYTSCNGINSIRALIWQDDETPPVGVVQIAHGVAEHIERYDAFARFLVGQGYVVAGNDHLGHGKSVNMIDELGHFADEDGDVRMVDDMHILFNIMTKRYPGKPYFLFGHSMGSMLARQYCTVFGFELTGAIFCGTGNVPWALSYAKAGLDLMVERLGPQSRKFDLAALNFASYNKDFEEENDPYAWLSKNPENRENYRNDPYCGFGLTAAASRDLATVALKISSPDWAFKIPVDLPILFISGSLDPVGGKGKWVIKAADELEKAGHRAEVILYPGYRHEILNEDIKDTVMEDVAKWMRDVLAAV